MLLEMTPKAGLRRDFDIPMTLPGNDDWDIYSTVIEPDAPTARPESVEQEEDSYNQWETNY